jgi:hypothetical protein
MIVHWLPGFLPRSISFMSYDLREFTLHYVLFCFILELRRFRLAPDDNLHLTSRSFMKKLETMDIYVSIYVCFGHVLPKATPYLLKRFFIYHLSLSSLPCLFIVGCLSVGSYNRPWGWSDCAISSDLSVITQVLDWSHSICSMHIFISKLQLKRSQFLCYV